MDKRYKRRGLVIIAEESQGSSDEAIQEVAKDKRMKFAVTKGSSRVGAGGGLPRAVVFNPAGKLVYNGSPLEDDFEKEVKKALRDVGKVSTPSEEEEESTTTETETKTESKYLLPSRAWTNTQGKKITATAVALDGDEVTFLLPNGKLVDYPLAKLTDADQKLLKEAAGRATE